MHKAPWAPRAPAQASRVIRAAVQWSGRQIAFDRLVIGLFALLVVGLVFYPVFFLVLSSLNVGDPAPSMRTITRLGLSNYGAILDHLNWLRNSLVVSIGGTLLALTIGGTLAWIINRTTVPWRRAFEQLVVIPFYVTPIVGALAWSLLGAERTGIINQVFRAVFRTEAAIINSHSALGIIIVMAIYEGTIAFIIISAAMKSMDPALEESSSILGAGRLYTAVKVTLPLLTPAVLGAGVLIFAMMMGSFSVPAILGMNVHFFVVTTGIYNLLNTWPVDYSRAAAMGISLFFFTGVAIWTYTRILRGRSFVTVTGKAYRPRLIDMGRWTLLLFGICALYVIVGVLLPLGTIVYASFLRYTTTTLANISWTLENYQTILFTYGPTKLAIRNSLVLGLLTASIGIIFMGLVSWIIYRTNLRGRGLLEYVGMFPQSIPALVLAIGLLWGWLFVPIGFYGTIWILLLAYLTIFLPMGLRTISGVLLQLDKTLEESARVCGAGWLRTVRSITMPLLRPGLLSAWVLLFIVAVREISSSVLLATSKSMVIGPSILVLYEMGGMPTVSALSVVQSAIVFGALLVATAIAGRQVYVE